MFFAKAIQNILVAALIFFNFAILQSSEQRNQNLITAVQAGELEKVKDLITQGASVNAKDDSCWTALMWATVRGHIDIVKYLTTHGADINAKDDDNNTVIMFAANKGHAKIVAELIERGADVNAKDDFCWTALMIAAQQGHPETVECLIEHGADVNARNSRGCTALMFAIDYRHTDTVRYLIEHGADITTINALTARVKQQQPRLKELSAHYKAYETLLNYLEKISIIQRSLKDALAEELVELDIEHTIQDHYKTEQEGIAQGIKEETTPKQKEQTRAKTFERDCCSIS